MSKYLTKSVAATISALLLLGCAAPAFAADATVEKKETTESVDYAVYGAKVAHCVADGKADYGVLVCSTGIGISMAANKVKGIRAALCSDAHAAEMTRRHNNANILCLGGLVTEEKTALEIVDTFLKFDFEGGRHQRRIDQIADIENGRL